MSFILSPRKQAVRSHPHTTPSTLWAWPAKRFLLVDAASVQLKLHSILMNIHKQLWRRPRCHDCVPLREEKYHDSKGVLVSVQVNSVTSTHLTPVLVASSWIRVVPCHLNIFPIETHYSHPFYSCARLSAWFLRDFVMWISPKCVTASLSHRKSCDPHISYLYLCFVECVVGG